MNRPQTAILLALLGLLLGACAREGPNRPAAGTPAELPQEITNSIGMHLQLIIPGSFTMGYEGEGALDHERPAHEVILTKAYYIGVYEVTQAEYEAVMGANPSQVKGSRLPVHSVTWEEAAEFCRRLSEREGVTYRLPTEAEWEYACRAGTATRYFWGDDPMKVGTYAWYEGDSGNQPHPVGQKQPNAWGLYDMAGNVEEWANDRFRAFSSKAQTDPQGASWGGNGRPLRGGSFFYGPEYLHSSCRHPNSTTDRDMRFGFRVVQEAN